MADGEVRLEGARELRRSLRRAGMDLDQLKEGHREAGAIVAGAAGMAAPRRTGRLAASVRASGTTTAAIVRAGRKSVPYAQVIHWGWPRRGIRAQPWVSEAAQRTEPQWVQAYEQAVQRVLDTIKGA